jgi:nicotinate-nucleotide pyrophosphorylase (carboxylating)
MRDFHQIVWGEDVREEWAALLRLAVREDLEDQCDWTSEALVPEATMGRAAVVARRPGVLAGEPAVAMTLAAFHRRLVWSPAANDGEAVAPGRVIGRIEGPARGLLAAERLVLNLLGRLSGIATLTRKYVEAVAPTRARIYDTRKTTPGWRKLEKYAVGCGGGSNHRTGLFEAVLIKDNHLALAAELPPAGSAPDSPAEAVVRARRFLADRLGDAGRGMLVEIEVDRLDQFDRVITVGPDLVLLDNMPVEEIRQAVARRDARCPTVELEASGGISLENVRRIAETGVERISVGALTHAAVSLDFGLDWLPR